MTRNRDVGGARTVDGDAIARIVARPADESAIDKRGARRVDLGHEGIRLSTVEGQVRTGCLRKAGLEGVGRACYIGVPRGVDSDPPGLVDTGAAEVAAVDEDGRVDDEGQVRVVGADIETIIARRVARAGTGCFRRGRGPAPRLKPA